MFVSSLAVSTSSEASWAQLRRSAYSKREDDEENQRTNDKEEQRHARTPLAPAYQFSNVVRASDRISRARAIVFRLSAHFGSKGAAGRESRRPCYDEPLRDQGNRC